MKAAEYRIMADVEGSHWWYLAQREALRCVLERHNIACPSPDVKVLDVGCGTGGHLRWLQTLLRPAFLAGFDRNADAVRLAQEKVPEAHIWCDDLTCLSGRLSALRFDLMLCSDVIYSIDQSFVSSALQVVVRSLRSGGLFLLHVPALPWLFSHHDESVGTVHRYRLREVSALMDSLKLESQFISYRMFLLFPLIVLRRLPGILGRFRKAQQATAARNVEAICDQAGSELEKPAAWCNSLLLHASNLESRWIRCGRTFPWGSSILAVGRKP